MKKMMICAGLFLFAASAVHAGCDQENIVVDNTISASLLKTVEDVSTFYKQKRIMNIPVNSADNSGCIYKEGTLSLALVTVLKDEKIVEGKVVISPINADFENIKDPSVKQYIYVAKDNAALENAPAYTVPTVHLLSYICSGEKPMLVDSISQKLQSYRVKQFSEHSLVATGLAAKLLAQRIARVMQDQTFLTFSELYVKTTGQAPALADVATQSVPSVYTRQSFEAGNVRLRSATSSVAGSVLNGCSKEFENAMAKYKLENYLENESVRGLSPSYDQDDNVLILDWTRFIPN